jgi:hypothetical protein
MLSSSAPGSAVPDDRSRLVGNHHGGELDTRTPVILLDSNGYAFYQDPRGQSILPADRYAVRLVTDITKVDQAKGPELDSVIGVPADDHSRADAVRQQYLLDKSVSVRLATVSERLLMPAAQLREELRIPGPTVTQTLPFRDKILMKQRLREAGVRVPDFAEFSEKAAWRLARAHSGVVVKPRLGAGAEDIFLLRSTDDLDAFMRGRPWHDAFFEAEEYIGGPLFHVDSVVREGMVVAATAGRYLDETMAYKTLAPCRDVAVPDGALLDELLDFNQRVIDCYPWFTGVMHHEMFLNEDGICFCEIAARAGGGGVPAGFWSRTGMNLHQIVVQAQALEPVPGKIQVASHLTGWVMIYAGAGVLRQPVQFPDAPWVIEARAFAEPGDRLRAPGSCGEGIALVSVAGASEAEVTSRLALVAESCIPDVAPDGQAGCPDTASHTER